MSARTGQFAGTAGPYPQAEGDNGMKNDEVVIGVSYSAKVGGKTVDVRIDGENARGGWNGTAVATGKPVRVKDARQIRGPAAGDGGRTVEPADDTGDTAPPSDDDLVPLTKLDKAKRAGKKAKGAKAPKEKVAKASKPPKEKKDKALSCLDAAAAVLKAKGEPMRCADMITAMKDKGLWETSAPTPASTLYSAVLREITNKGSASRFKKTDRGLFTLKE